MTAPATNAAALLELMLAVMRLHIVELATVHSAVTGLRRVRVSKWGAS